EVILPRENEAVVDVAEPLQARALVIPVVDGEQRRAVPLQLFSLPPETVQQELAVAANVWPAKEAGLGLKILGGVLIQDIELDAARAALDVDVVRGPALVRAVVELGEAGYGLCRGDPFRGELELGVDSGDTVLADDAGIGSANGQRHGV